MRWSEANRQFTPQKKSIFLMQASDFVELFDSNLIQEIGVQGIIYSIGLVHCMRKKYGSLSSYYSMSGAESLI